MSDLIRKQFEEWVESYGWGSKKDDEGYYQETTTQMAWNAWTEQNDRIAELEREKSELVAQVEVLNSKNFELTCYRVDVIRCLKTIAFNHNHAEIIRYQPLARALMDSLPKDKELNQIKAEAVQGFLHVLEHAPSSPVSAMTALGISQWWPKFQAASIAKEE